MPKRILVVEDSRTYRNLLNMQLSHAGFEVTLAACYADAQTILTETTDFMCAVLDYCLPDAENGEIIDLVLGEGLRAIVLTGQFSDVIRESVIAKGVLDYITKDSTASVSYLLPLLKRLANNDIHKALVVDDSSMVRKHVQFLLEHQYIKTLLASDGKEALRLLSENPDISLVITDHDMPEKDGITLTREIRQHHDRNHLAILGLSGNSNRTLTARFLKAGANDFLYKPFNQEEFYCRVQHILDMKDATDELYRLANQDPLTSLWNRRYIFEFNETEDILQRNVAMIDIDFFKRVNDTWGHEFGDAVIVEVANQLRQHFENDLVARFGGEEFYVQNNGNYGRFIGGLEQLRQDVEKLTMKYDGEEVRVTVSVGAVCGSCEDELNRQIQIADERLYQAKQNGRNRLVTG